MPILYILLVLVLVGVLLWVIQQYVPMPPNYKRAIIIVVIVLMVIWVLQATGLFSSFGAGPRIGGG